MEGHIYKTWPNNNRSKISIRKNWNFAAIFAHTGHISKEDAREISGLDEGAFEHAFNKAAVVAEKFMNAEGQKLEKLLEHFGKEIEEHTNKLGLMF